jgi:hypothetical protein
VVIINQAMARRYWPKGDPLNGQLIIGKGVGPEFEEPARRIVGIVGGVRDAGLNRDPRPVMYIPVSQVRGGVTALNARIGPITWIVRTRVEPRHPHRPPRRPALRIAPPRRNQNWLRTRPPLVPGREALPGIRPHRTTWPCG